MKISELKLGDTVTINAHAYEYKGQQMRKDNGFKASRYVFKSKTTDFEKLFAVNAAIEIVKSGDALELKPKK